MYRVESNLSSVKSRIVLPVFGILPTSEICNDKNKSSHIAGFDNSVKYLHNIATYADGVKNILLSRL